MESRLFLFIVPYRRDSHYRSIRSNCDSNHYCKRLIHRNVIESNSTALLAFYIVREIVDFVQIWYISLACDIGFLRNVYLGRVHAFIVGHFTIDRVPLFYRFLERGRNDRLKSWIQRDWRLE